MIGLKEYKELIRYLSGIRNIPSCIPRSDACFFNFSISFRLMVALATIGKNVGFVTIFMCTRQDTDLFFCARRRATIGCLLKTLNYWNLFGVIGWISVGSEFVNNGFQRLHSNKLYRFKWQKSGSAKKLLRNAVFNLQFCYYRFPHFEVHALHIWRF